MKKIVLVLIFLTGCTWVPWVVPSKTNSDVSEQRCKSLCRSDNRFCRQDSSENNVECEKNLHECYNHCENQQVLIHIKYVDNSKLYYYKAQVLRIIDGDTIDVSILIGFNISLTERLRLARINAPEVRGEEREAGLAAKEWLISQIAIGSEILIRTEKDDSFGRYIAEIYLDDLNLNDEMVKVGHAEYKEY